MGKPHGNPDPRQFAKMRKIEIGSVVDLEPVRLVKTRKPRYKLSELMALQAIASSRRMGSGRTGRQRALVAIMARHTYTPDRGDLVHVNFSPSAGREFTGPHYALVLSPNTYNRTAGLALCVNITSRIRGGPFEVPLPKGHLPPKAGVGDVDSVILSDALRQLDYRERSMSLVAKCPPAILDEVALRSLSLIDPEAEF
jgi:mRNA interferase MazF